MLQYGVKTHRKILPAEKWFEKMVQIAKNQILQTYPDNIIDQLDIRYCDTIEQAIEAEAQAQAICMQTEDFRRAYEAFAAKQKPVFQGD